MEIATVRSPFLGSVVSPRLGAQRALLPWPGLALVGTCAAVAFLPFLQPAGPGNVSPIDGFIVFSLAATFGWAVMERLPIHMPYVVPVAVMALAGLIASLFSVYPGTGLLAVVQDLVLLAWSTAVVTVCRTPRGLSMVLRTWAYASVVWAGLMLLGALTGVHYLSGITGRTGVRASITFGDPNMAAGYYAASLMVMWASATPRHRAARWAAGAILITAIIFTGSNGFSLATLAACAVAAGIGIARRRGVLPVVVLFCGVALVAGVVGSQVNINTVVSDAASSSPLLRDYVGRFTQTTAGRDTLLHETLAQVGQGGLIGIGPGEVKATLQAEQETVAFQAHSDYSASIAERGLLGAAGFLLLILVIGFHARRVLGPLHSGYAAVVRHPGALVGALIAFAIAANIYELIHFRYVWTLLAMVAAASIWGWKRAT
jgi:O-Antigen ligase